MPESRLRYAVEVLTLVGDTVQPGTLSLADPPSNFIANLGSGIVGFNANSRWRLERFGAYLAPANVEHGYVQLTPSGADTSEFLPLSQQQGSVVELRWPMPVNWDGRIVVQPQLWNITTGSQTAMLVWAAFIEEPSAAARAGCFVELG